MIWSIYLSKFIKEYLKSRTLNQKYEVCKKFQEGINYSFSFSGGDNIIHWDFDTTAEYESEISNSVIVSKFCGRAMVIIDNDQNKNKPRKELLRKLLKERFVVLPLPEIENLLDESVIVNTVKTYPSCSSIKVPLDIDKEN